MYRRKPIKNTSEDTSGKKSTEIPQGIAEAKEAERATRSREVDFFPMRKRS